MFGRKKNKRHLPSIATAACKEVNERLYADLINVVCGVSLIENVFWVNDRRRHF